MSLAAGILPYCPKTGRYLIAKRGPTISNPNQWTNFGGKADKGENPAQTAVREFKEESGYKGSVRLNRPIPTKNNKDGITFYNFIGEVPAEFQPTTIGKKTVDGDVEVSASKWVTKEQLMGLIGNSILHPGFNRFLNLKFKQEESNMKNINYVKKLIRETVLKEESGNWSQELDEVPVRGDIVITRNMGRFFVVVKYGENLGIYKTIELATKKALSKLQPNKNLWYLGSENGNHWKYTK